MSPGLFISYRTEDAVFAGRIYDSLKRRFGADRIFFDQRSIRAGAKWVAEIERSLEGSAVFVLIITPGWSASFAERAASGGKDYHLREIELALDRGMAILPLVIDDAAPPADAALPEPLRGRLSMIQCERVRNDRTFDDSMDRLGAELAWVLQGGRAVGGAPTASAAPGWMAPPPPPPARTSAAPGAGPAALLATKEWRRSHSVWPWGLLCCGVATGPVFLYMGARTRNRSWLIAGAVYLSLLLVVMIGYSLVSDGIPSPSTATGSSTSTSSIDGSSRDSSFDDLPVGVGDADGVTAEPTTGETFISMVFFVYFVAGLVHLVAVNEAWLRLRAGADGPADQPQGAPSSGLPPSEGSIGSAF